MGVVRGDAEFAILQEVLVGRTSRVVVAALLAFTLASSAGCSSDEPASSSSQVPGRTLSVIVTAVPDTARGLAYLIAPKGGAPAVLARAEARAVAVLSTNEASSEPFDLTVYIPDNPAWDPTTPPAAGLYATKKGIGPNDSVVTVAGFDLDAAPPATERGAVAIGNAPIPKGTVTIGGQRSDGAPIGDKAVVVDGNLAVIAGSAPVTVPAGHHVVVVAAEGQLPVRKELDVAPGASTPIDVKLEAPPPGASARIRVVDAATKQLVPTSSVVDVLGNAPIEAVGDGTFVFQRWPAGIRINANTYATRQVGGFLYAGQLVDGKYADNVIEVVPLDRRFVGTWSLFERREVTRPFEAATGPSIEFRLDGTTPTTPDYPFWSNALGSDANPQPWLAIQNWVKGDLLDGNGYPRTKIEVYRLQGDVLEVQRLLGTVEHYRIGTGPAPTSTTATCATACENFKKQAATVCPAWLQEGRTARCEDGCLEEKEDYDQRKNGRTPEAFQAFLECATKFVMTSCPSNGGMNGLQDSTCGTQNLTP